ncbi:MAG TPA: XRE family transcriptional regulator [Lachnoclostridium sp.]|nr:XRE family transcriptional regulator [Lachnoclostridium sp.]
MRIRLNEYMHRNGLTERQVSILTGLSRSTIHEIRTGETMPRIDTLEIIAKGLNIRIRDLLDSPYF